MGNRSVPAPDGKDWLTESEVLVLLGEISSRTLDRYIDAGQFPQPVMWGTASKWRWEDIAWFYLGKVIASRLHNRDDTATTKERHGDDKGTTRERQRDDKARQTPTGD